mgnify:CR=1 FL=1
MNPEYKNYNCRTRISLCSISISNAIKVDTSKITADDNYYTLATDSRYYFAEDGEKLKENLKAKLLKNVLAKVNREIKIQRKNEVFPDFCHI